MSKLKKILIFVPDLHSGGVATVVETFLEGFKDNKKFNIDIVVFDKAEITKEIPNNSRLIKFNLYLWKNYGKNKLDKLKRSVLRIPHLFIAYFKLRKIISNNKYDYIISHSAILNLISVFLKSKNRLKSYLILVDHQYPEHNAIRLIDKIINRYSKRYYKFADKIVCISSDILNYHKNNTKIDDCKLVFIPNPIRIEKIRTDMSQEINDNKESSIFENPVIINMGRLSFQKGQWHLIKMMPKLLESYPNLKLVFLGDGEKKQDLKDLCKLINVEESVYFLGNKRNPFKYISKSEIFLFPSLWEGFPMALIEALSCGIPAISTNCLSGPKDIMFDDDKFNQDLMYNESPYGYLTREFSLDESISEIKLNHLEEVWIELINNILLSKELKRKMAKKAYFNMEKYDIINITKRWLEILKYEN